MILEKNIKSNQDYNPKVKTIKTVLPMIVYTSGILHMGHARSYTAISAISRWIRNKEGQCYCPFGFDAHGLPTEMKARIHNLHPIVWTESCIDRMENIIDKMNFQFTLPRLFTYKTNYYLQQQQIFIDLFRAGFIYNKESYVFWDPVAETTLAKEQLTIDGFSERTGGKVEEKKMKQWFFDLPRLAKNLSNSLENLDWPSKIINSQKTWINWNEHYIFDIKYNKKLFFNKNLKGLSYIETNSFTTKEKYIEILNVKIEIIHNKNLDEEFYYARSGNKILLNIEELKSNFKNHKKITTNLHEWCISRQRSFGCPIPAIKCSKCGILVDEKFITSNPLEECEYKKTLSEFEDWLYIKCPLCSSWAQRESDTLDVLFDSSWYPIWYRDNGNASLPIDIYIGGREHANGHLLYIRAMFKALNIIGYSVPQEPITKFIDNGMVNCEIYLNEDNNYISPKNVIRDNDGKLRDNLNKEVKIVGNEKMSKSKGNVINIEDLLNDYDSDEIRLAILSDYPLEKDYNWSFKSLNSVKKNINKIRKYLQMGNFSILQDTKSDIFYNKFSFNKLIAYAFSILKQENNFENRSKLAYALEPILVNLFNEFK